MLQSKLFELAQNKTYKITWAPSKEWSTCTIVLIRVFTVCMMKFYVLVQADLSLCGEHISVLGFVVLFLILNDFMLYNVSFFSHRFSMGDLGVQVSVRLFVCPSVRPSVCLSVRPSTFTMGVLWAQLLLQFFYRSCWNFADIFFMVWGCACGLDIIVGLFFITFSTLWT